MIKIADNPIVRGQLEKPDREAGATEPASVTQASPADAPAYPAKILVLDGGRYYAGKTEK